MAAASRYDFEKYPPNEFKNFAGYWIKKEIVEELFCANRRARGKIVISRLITDVSSANYRSKEHHPKLWSEFIRQILLLMRMDRTQFAKLIGVQPGTVYRWEKQIRTPSVEVQKRIVRALVVIHGGLF